MSDGSGRIRLPPLVERAGRLIPSPVWAPAAMPRLTAVRLPENSAPMTQAAYLRLLQGRVWGLINRLPEAEARHVLQDLAPAAAALVDDAPIGQVAEILFEMTDELTGGPVAEALSQVKWPATPSPAPETVARQVQETSLRAWLRLAVQAET